MKQFFLFLVLFVSACNASNDMSASRLQEAGLLIADCRLARQDALAVEPATNDGAASPPWVHEARAGVVCYDGLVTWDVSEQIVARNEPIETLVVRSLGGEGPAGIRIGEKLNEWGTHVVVWDRCFSACAAYFFTGSARQTVPEPGVVGWHQGLAFTRYGALFASPESQPPALREIASHATRRLFETGRNDVPDPVWRALPEDVRDSLTRSRNWRLRLERFQGYAQIPDGMLSAHHLVRAQMPAFAAEALRERGSMPALFWTPGVENLQAWEFDDLVMWEPDGPEDILVLGLERSPPTTNIRMTINPGDFPVRDDPSLPDDSAEWPLEGLQRVAN